jgi:hypothetical protein
MTNCFRNDSGHQVLVHEGFEKMNGDQLYDSLLKALLSKSRYSGKYKTIALNLLETVDGLHKAGFFHNYLIVDNVMVSRVSCKVKLYSFNDFSRNNGAFKYKPVYSTKQNEYLYKRYIGNSLMHQIIPNQMFDVYGLLSLIYFLTQTGPEVDKYLK